MPAPIDSARLDSLFHLLKNPRRRVLCTYVTEAERDLFHVEDLVTRVAKYERERGGAADGEDDDALRRRVAIDVRCHHLPSLQDASLLEYDPRSGHVTLRDTELAAELREMSAEELLRSETAAADR